MLYSALISRLSKQLRLPPTTGRPPCPPRIYKKLYTYLEKSLSKPSTGSKRQTTDTIPSPAKRRATASAGETTPSKSTTRQRPVRGPFSDNVRGEKAARQGGAKSGRINDAPSWTMPIIRRICKAVPSQTKNTTHVSASTSASFPPHIFAGLSSILALVPTLQAGGDDNEPHAHTDFFSPILSNEPESQVKEFRDRVITLIVALYFVVLRRSQASQSGELELEAFTEMTRVALASAGLTDEKYSGDVDTWVVKIVQDSRVEEHEWFKNVPRSSGDDEDSLNGKNGEDDEDEEVMTFRKRKYMNRHAARLSRDQGQGGLLPGLGTMMSDRLDWLSEERRFDYARWKNDVMQRVHDIEQRVAVG